MSPDKEGHDCLLRDEDDLVVVSIYPTFEVPPAESDLI